MNLGNKWTFDNHRTDRGYVSRPSPNELAKLRSEKSQGDVEVFSQSPAGARPAAGAEDQSDGEKSEIIKSSPFVPYRVEFLIKDILETTLRGVKYEPVLCSSLTQDLCVRIKERTKKLDYPDHRFVCQVMIGQDTEHQVQISSRCLWNHSTDNFAAATFRNASIYAIAVIYAMHIQ